MDWQLGGVGLENTLFKTTEQVGLRHYLPQFLAERLLSLNPPPMAGDLALALIHLASLLHAIATYLPLSLVRRRLDEPTENLVWGERKEGTLVFADISGFTAMSELLAAHGREGAEVMTNIVNGVFAALLEPLSCFGGELLRFGGDSMLSGFWDDDHSLRGITAALTMQERMAGFSEVKTPLGTFPLAMSIGVNSGPFLVASVGTERGADYWTAGPVVNETARTRNACQARKVLLTESTRQLLGDRAKTCPSSRFHEVLELQKARPEESLDFIVPVDLSNADTFAVQIGSFLERIEALNPYLPAGLVDKLVVDPQQPILEGEHRRVSNCFVNVLGFGRLIKLSIPKLAPGQREEDVPTDLLRLLDRYFTTVQDIILRYEGFINKIDLAVEGDRLLTVFGAPLSHEDDPERALSTALEIKKGLASVNDETRDFLERRFPGERVQGLPLAQRIGLSTGDVFTGNVGAPSRKEYTVMGDAVIVAARLMDLAQPGEVYLDESTFNHARRGFVFSQSEPVQLKGKAGPVMAYLLLGQQQEEKKPGFGHNGAASARRGEILPLVDRDKERDLLQQVMKDALGGQGQLIEVSGVAGLGKSRLVAEMAGWWAGKPGVVYSGDCRYYGRSTPYLPWLDIFQEFFGLKPGDVPAEQQGKIMERVLALRPDLAEWTPLISDFLGVPAPRLEWLESLSGELRRARLFDILADFLGAESVRRPILLVLEDWHWADLASAQLLEYITQNLDKKPVCICTVCRPSEEMVSPTSGMRLTTLLLEELTREDSSSLVSERLRGANASQELLELIWGRTQGNPLFIEEMLQTLLEGEHLVLRSDSYQLTQQPEMTRIPQTIQELLMARLDRLGEPARDLLRLASVIGQRFSGELLDELIRFLEPTEYLRYLEELISLGVVRQEPGGPDYRFSQPLLREVVYESLPFARRRALHGQVAAALERRYLGKGQQVEPELYDRLAYHYTRSEQKEKAVEYSIKAGDKAREAYANELALNYYNQALELLDEAETSRARSEERQRERTIRRYQVLAAREQVLALFGRRAGQRSDLDEMMSIAEALGDVERLSDVTNRLSLFHYNVGNYREAMQTAQAALVLEQQSGDRKGEGESLYYLACACHQLDESDRAQRYYEESLVVARDTKDPLAECHRLNGLGVFYWQVGDLEQARRRLEKALDVARHSGYLQGEGNSLGNLGLIHCARGEYELALRCFERGLEIARDIGDRPAEGARRADLGHLYGLLGVWEKAREELGWSLVSARRARNRSGEAGRFYLLALVSIWAGDYLVALELLSRALQIAREMGDRRVAGNVYHGFGLVYLEQGHYEMALDSFNQAIRLRGLSDQRGELLRDLSYTALAHLGMGERDKALRCSLEVVDLLEGEVAPQILGAVPEVRAPTGEERGQAQEGLPDDGSGQGEVETGLRLAQKIVVQEPQQMFSNHFHLLCLLGQKDKAQPYLQKAQHILTTRANRIEDRNLRRSYLTNVAANRAIMEVWNDEELRRCSPPDEGFSED